MPIVRLGKMVLRWCNQCNLPILESKTCEVCGSVTKQVKVTPPGDIRPAFNYDLNQIREVITHQFGKGTGDLVLPPAKTIVILNKAPDIDRMDEVIIDGEVIGALKYDLKTRKFKFLARMRAAQALAPTLSKSSVIIDKGAVEPVLNKANVLAPGVITADKNIGVGDEVIVFDEDRTPLAVGSAKMTGLDMIKNTRGLSVKVRWTARNSEIAQPQNKVENNWETVVNANQRSLGQKIAEAVGFIRRTVKKYDMPQVVSYSGGKDSLATLLLVLEAGIKPQLLFIDTGLEFPETVEHVRDLAHKYDLELIEERAGDAFWDAVGYFGPPGKDFRWCCKTCKLGPATRLIKDHFQNGVLAFIGQRSYESMARSKSHRVWNNPWVPGQLGASPIQTWSAFHVWLYLFQKGVEYNSWYEKGMERIGCWLCPANDLGDLVLVGEQFPDYERWEQFLNDYAMDKGYTQDWVDYGMWRWKRLPNSMQNLVNELGLTIRSEARPDELPKASAAGIINFYTSGSGYVPCENGISLEGVFDRKLDIDRVANLLNILGEVNIDRNSDSCSINGLADVYGEGAVVVKGKTEREVDKSAAKLKNIIIRAIECVGCGVCPGRCENDALDVDGQVQIDETKCTHCGKCLGPCPVVDFGVEREFVF